MQTQVQQPLLALLFAMVAILDVALVIISLVDMAVIDKATFAPISGWLLLLIGILGVYLSGGNIVNEAFDRTIIPIPGPIIK